MGKVLVACLILCGLSQSGAFCPSVSFGGALAGSRSALPLRNAASRVTRRMDLGVTMDADWYKVSKGESCDGGGFKYTFNVDVDGKICKDKYGTVMKEFKKTARFPGFRIGTIPPFMTNKVKQFVILECLEKTLGDAVTDQNLELCNDTKPMLDDAQVTKLTAEFKEGGPFSYSITCDLKPKAGAAAVDAVVDVKAEEAA